MISDQWIDLNSGESRCLDTILLRVWSWLRMNAGGVLNTCKSNGVPMTEDSSNGLGYLVADGGVTREEPASEWGITQRKLC